MKSDLYYFIILILFLTNCAFAQEEPESLCGPDDRVTFTDLAVGRIIHTAFTNSASTGFIIANGKIVTAGHVYNLIQQGDWLEFNVKPSLSNGTLQHSEFEDRYMIDMSSISYQYEGGLASGYGKDWMVFSVLPNSLTGLTPIEAQQSFKIAKKTYNPGSVNIRITGYGEDDGSTNQVQQTSTGTYAGYGPQSNFHKYATDTENGNSGSPIIDESTGFVIGVHCRGLCPEYGYNGGTSFTNTGFWNAVNVGDIITIDQKRESGSILTGTIISHYEARFATDEFLDYQIPSNNGVLFQFNKNNTETFRSLQELVFNPTEKYYRWNNLNDVTNHKSFLLDNIITEFVSNFKQVYSNVTIKNEYPEISELNPTDDDIDFKDPWLIDYYDPNFGNAKRNRGMKQSGIDALIFRTRLSPFSPNYFNYYENDVYRGIFLDQNPTYDPNLPIYSVRSQVQDVFLSQTNRWHKFYFYDWTGTNVNFQYPKSNETAIVFTTDNATITANLKGAQLSTDVNAYKYNNQRKFIRTPNGTLHSTYHSMNSVWYETSTDNGQTWQLKDYSMPTDPTWIESEPSISYYVNSSNKTIVIIAWRQQHGLPEDLIKMKIYVYDPVYGLTETDEQDIFEENPEMLTIERTSPVVTCAPDGKTLVVWENKINGVPANFKYSYGERLSNGVWQWWQTSQWLECTASGALSPAVYASNIDYFLKFHLAWAQNNKIYYCGIYPNDENELEYDLQNTEVSAGSGYTTHSRPTITATDFVSGSYRFEWLRFAWIGFRDADIDDPCAVSAGESRVLYKYKTSSSWSSITALGSNTNSVSINKGTIVMNYWEPMACAWSEGNNCNYPNKYFRSNDVSKIIIRTLNTTGDHLQLNNSTDFSTMYANSFHRNSSPYFFLVSNNLAGQIEKTESIEIFKGREGVVTKDNAGFYYAIGDITVDGDVKDFKDFPDTISINHLQTMNEFLISEPFNVTSSSTLTYGVQYGITDSAEAVTALSDSSEISFRVELVDNQTGEVLGVFDEITFSSGNVFQYNNIGYEVDLSGIGARTVVLKLVTSTEAACYYSITNRYSDTEALNKIGYRQIIYKENMIVKEYVLEQNYPNPFNPTTTIKYEIPKSGKVTLKVYDILGSEVATLIDALQETGRYEVNFDAGRLSSGVYIYTLNVNDYVNVKKMVLLK